MNSSCDNFSLPVIQARSWVIASIFKIHQVPWPLLPLSFRHRAFIQSPFFLTLPNGSAIGPCIVQSLYLENISPQFFIPKCSCGSLLTSFIALLRCTLSARCSLTSLVKIAYHLFWHYPSAFLTGCLTYISFLRGVLFCSLLYPQFLK